jgi:hypothetical protein
MQSLALLEKAYEDRDVLPRELTAAACVHS